MQTEQMYQAQRLMKRIMDATHAMASKRTDWDEAMLKEAYSKVYPGKLAPSSFSRTEFTTWEWLFPCSGRARNHVVMKDGGAPPLLDLKRKRLEKIESLFVVLGILQPDERVPHCGQSPEEWLGFLEFLFSKVRIEHPPGHEGLPGHGNTGSQRHPIHTLIHLSLGDDFVGRESLLEELHARFRPVEATTDVSIVVIHGLGGLGKTRASEEYAYKYMKLGIYDFVLFVGADTEDILRSNILETVRSGRLKIAPDAADYNTAVVALQEWLHNHKKWLVILDNADSQDAAAAIKKLLPRLAGGHVLITSRISHWGRNIGVQELKQLHPDAARSYLLQSTEDGKCREAGDEADAGRLAKRLGCTPSLLVYAGAYITYNPISFRDYEKLWLEKREELVWLDPKKAEQLAGYPTPEAAATWLTSFDKLSGPARHLIECLAWFGPEPIPRSLVRHDRELANALAELEGYSLITNVESETNKHHSFTINSALQDIARIKLEATRHIQPLVDAAGLIEKAFAREKAMLVPHAVKVLHFLRDDKYMASKAADLLDSMGRLAVMALPNIEDAGAESIDYLITLLGDFYEVELLAPILGKLAKKRDVWDWVQERLLKADNYVLRYGMAEAIVENWPEAEIVSLFNKYKESKNINEFELAGYALALAYAGESDPDKIDPQLLAALAKRKAYCGRSILGDLFLNLAFRARRKGTRLEKLDSLAGPRFWEPIWDFIKLDVDAIRAAEALMDPHLPVSKETEVVRTLESFRSIRADLSKLERNPRFGKEIHKLREDYFKLGEDPNGVRDAQDELDSLDNDDLKKWMRLLFAHPIWSVAESAATVLSTLAENEERRAERLAIIRELLDYKPNWRVQFGACEAAFAVRHVDREALFFASVHEHYDHESCKIRGLCAENLISLMLNSSNDKCNTLYNRFKKEITRWVCDEDCWVLEHVFRLFHTLDRRKTPLVENLGKRKVKVSVANLAKGSRLLRNAGDWHQLERGAFLELLEDRQEELKGARKLRRAG
jgi:hypothetical protein